MTEDLNLENLKVGDEIVTIRPSKEGLKYGAVKVLTVWEDGHKKWRYAHPSNLSKNVGWFPLTGHGYDFMSKRKTPDFYYSANPEHIKNSKAYYEQARINTEEKCRRMDLALPIGDLLHTEYYYDSEECYNLDTTFEITETLIDKLTDEQIVTLKGWLGV